MTSTKILRANSSSAQPHLKQNLLKAQIPGVIAVCLAQCHRMLQNATDTTSILTLLASAHTPLKKAHTIILLHIHPIKCYLLACVALSTLQLHRPSLPPPSATCPGRIPAATCRICPEGVSTPSGGTHDPKACRTGALCKSQQHPHIQRPPAAPALSGHQLPVGGAITTPGCAAQGRCTSPQDRSLHPSHHNHSKGRNMQLPGTDSISAWTATTSTTEHASYAIKAASLRVRHFST